MAILCPAHAGKEGGTCKWSSADYRYSVEVADDDMLGEVIGADGSGVESGVRGDRRKRDRNLLGTFRATLGGHGDFRELVAVCSRARGIGVGR
jgi:hypothetical protein